MYKRLTEAAKFIQSRTSLKPTVGVILGSGMGEYAKQVKNPVSIPFSEIPHFLPTTVEGHEGHLILGTILNSEKQQTSVAILQGRLHYYEGHSMDQVAFPARTLCMLGIDSLVLTNAAGGINPAFREADLMLITDQINLMGDNPLRGPNVKELGPRFPDLTEAYHQKYQDIFRQSAKKLQIDLREGVYVGLSGPTYETPAEVRMLRLLGGDAVGMSTVPEAIAANHLGVRVAGISCITNLAAGITSSKLTHNEVIESARKASGKMITLLNEALPKIGEKRA